MTKFQVSANGQALGVYEGETAQDARNACAVDAGYKGEADMVAQLESPSELSADAVEEFTPGFINSTVGLECNGHGMLAKMVRVHFTRNEDGSVKLEAVNGRNLARMKGTAQVTAENYENRPDGDIARARWALKHCGWSLMSDDAEQ